MNFGFRTGIVTLASSLFACRYGMRYATQATDSRPELEDLSLTRTKALGTTVPTSHRADGRPGSSTIEASFDWSCGRCGTKC